MKFGKFRFGKAPKESNDSEVDIDKQPETGKQGVAGFLDKHARMIPVNIIKKRGNAVIVDRIRATEQKTNKDSEIVSLKSGKKVLLDAIDYSRMNNDGSFTLIEKPDGQYAYADVDKSVINSAGEGVLRDAFVVLNEWIDLNFRKKADLMSMLSPVLVLVVAALCIGGSLYLTYGYLNDAMTKADESNKRADTMLLSAVDTLDRMSRTQTAATENLLKISEQMNQIAQTLLQRQQIAVQPTTTTSTSSTTTTTIPENTTV